MQEHVISVDTFDPATIIPELSLGPVSTRRVYPLVKRLIDFLGSAVLLVLLMPMFLVIALVVRFDSPGPALFRQQRVGLAGKRFTMLKFRSMTVSSPSYSYKVPLDDPSITRSGRFLRRSGLDELPQLINVLRGEMSLVGPRPELPFIVDRYEPWQHQRHQVRPGMTGWWQIQERREVRTLYADASDATHASRFPLDLYYLENLSFLLDLKILWLTAGVVFTQLIGQ